MVTLIVTAVSDLGILQISDSNLTHDDGALAGVGPKVFPLGFCPGALALAGSYGVNHVSMDAWMPHVIDGYALSNAPSLEGFAQHLATRLMAETEPGETALMVQIAGYVSDTSGSHPEMWFVRNFGGIDDATGAYTERSDEFTVTEDFWRRDYVQDCAMGRVPGGSYLRWYFNGLPEGRISFNALNAMYWTFLRSVWAQPAWALRPPQDISQLAVLMRHELRIIGSLFEVSGLNYVGGDVQIEEVPPPANAIVL